MRTFPTRPNLEHLKNEAKQRLEAIRVKVPRARLTEVQFQLAREYGYASWRELKANLDQRVTGANVVGDWIGFLSPDLRVALHVRDNGGNLIATMDSPDYGSFGFSVQDFKINGDALSLTLLKINVLYEAAWDASTATWNGQWLQNGVALPLTLRRGVFPSNPIISGLDGVWEGLVALDNPIRLIFHIRTDTHGTFASCDSPDRNGYNFPASSLNREDRKVTIIMKTARITGDLGDDGKTISAIFSQGGIDAPVILKRREPGAAVLRLPDPPVIEVAPKILASYAGVYELSPGRLVTVTFDNGGLFAKLTHQPAYEIFAASQTEFFFRIVEARVVFKVEADGHVPVLTLHQNGRETQASRLLS